MGWINVESCWTIRHSYVEIFRFSTSRTETLPNIYWHLRGGLLWDPVYGESTSESSTAQTRGQNPIHCGTIPVRFGSQPGKTRKLSTLLHRIYEKHISRFLQSLIDLGFVCRWSSPHTFGLGQVYVFRIIAFHQEKPGITKNISQSRRVICNKNARLLWNLTKDMNPCASGTFSDYLFSVASTAFHHLQNKVWIVINLFLTVKTSRLCYLR